MCLDSYASLNLRRTGRISHYPETHSIIHYPSTHMVRPAMKLECACQICICELTVHASMDACIGQQLGDANCRRRIQAWPTACQLEPIKDETTAAHCTAFLSFHYLSHLCSVRGSEYSPSPTPAAATPCRIRFRPQHRIKNYRCVNSLRLMRCNSRRARSVEQLYATDWFETCCTRACSSPGKPCSPTTPGRCGSCSG